MATAQVKINRGALSKFLGKTVQPFLMKKGREIAEEAKRLAPKGATGQLENSITVEAGERGSVIIRANADYAGFVHQGTGPQHTPSPRAPYFPKLRRSGLILWSESKAANPYAVAHGISVTGTKANPFLTNSVEKVLRRYNFNWINRNVF